MRVCGLFKGEDETKSKDEVDEGDQQRRTYVVGVCEFDNERIKELPDATDGLGYGKTSGLNVLGEGLHDPQHVERVLSD